MLPYLITFAVACFLFQLAEEEKKRMGKRAVFLYGGSAIVVLSVLAGAREYGIGTDTMGYGIWLFNLACSEPDYFTYMDLAMHDKIHMDPLFAVQAYLVVNATGSIFWYYFAIEAVMLIPVYLVVRDFAHPTMVAPCMLLYLLIFYIPGYNAMRQYIAMSFVLLSFAKLYRGHYLASVISYACALLYHVSAIIGLIPLLSWVFFFKRDGDGSHAPRYLAKLLWLPCFVVVSVVLAESLVIVDWLTSTIPVFAKYHYTLTYGGSGHLSGYVLFGFLLAMLVYLAHKNGLLKQGVVVFLICMVALHFPLLSLEVYSQALQRMARYMLLFAVPLFAIAAKEGRELRRITACESAVHACSLVAFVWIYAISGANDAVPYASFLFNS